jgi:sugar/nucleoside kinase (ribokinase family)
MDVYIAPSGRIFLDFIFSGLDRVPTAGEEHYSKNFAAMLGGTFNVARALVRLNIDAHLAADVGTDLPSRIVRSLWDQAHVPTTFRREIAQAATAITCSYSMPHDRAFLSYVDPLPRPDASPDLLIRHKVGHVVLPGFPHDESLLPMLEKARELKIPSYLDGQFTERSSDHPFVRKHISLVEYFMCNSLEARALTGHEDPAKAALALAEIAPAAIVKAGADGAALARDGKIVRCVAPRVEFVDSTGAGDCFLAGFVYAKVHDKDDKEALRIATAVGSLTCTGPGGEAAPTEDQLTRFLGA